MKKIFFALMAVAAIMFTSCEKELTGVSIVAGVAEPNSTVEIHSSDASGVWNLSGFLQAFEDEFKNLSETHVIMSREEMAFPFVSKIEISGMETKNVKSAVETRADAAVKKAIEECKSMYPEYYQSFTFRVTYQVTYPTTKMEVYDIKVEGWDNEK